MVILAQGGEDNEVVVPAGGGEDIRMVDLVAEGEDIQVVVLAGGGEDIQEGENTQRGLAEAAAPVICSMLARNRLIASVEQSIVSCM